MCIRDSHDGRPRPQVLLQRAHRHPPHRLHQEGRRDRGQPRARQGGQEQGGATVPAGGVRPHVRLSLIHICLRRCRKREGAVFREGACTCQPVMGPRRRRPWARHAQARPTAAAFAGASGDRRAACFRRSRGCVRSQDVVPARPESSGFPLSVRRQIGYAKQLWTAARGVPCLLYTSRCV